MLRIRTLSFPPSTLTMYWQYLAIPIGTADYLHFTLPTAPTKGFLSSGWTWSAESLTEASALGGTRLLGSSRRHSVMKWPHSPPPLTSVHKQLCPSRYWNDSQIWFPLGPKCTKKNFAKTVFPAQISYFRL